jgi:hypothetical protein
MAVGTAAAVPVGRMTISLHDGGPISLLEIAPWAGSALAAEAVPGGCEVPRVGLYIEGLISQAYVYPHKQSFSP